MGAGEGFERVPDGIVPLVGYRMWRVEPVAEEPAFFPLRRPSPDWFGATRGWVSATCPIRPHPQADDEGDVLLGGPSSHAAPGEDCSCGFYAMKELDSALVLAASDPVTFGKEGVLVPGSCRARRQGDRTRPRLSSRASPHRRADPRPPRAEGRQRDRAPCRDICGPARQGAARTDPGPFGRYRVAWTESQATPRERSGYSVVLLVLWVVYRVWLAAHSGGGTR